MQCLVAYHSFSHAFYPQSTQCVKTIQRKKNARFYFDRKKKKSLKGSNTKNEYRYEQQARNAECGICDKYGHKKIIKRGRSSLSLSLRRVAKVASTSIVQVNLDRLLAMGAVRIETDTGLNLGLGHHDTIHA